LIFPTLG